MSTDLKTHSIIELLHAQNKLLHQDWIEPHILCPGGLLTFGTTYDSECRKTDFLLSWMLHMAAGRTFLHFRPARPLSIFYLQTEKEYTDLSDYLHNRFNRYLLQYASGNLAISSPWTVLDEQGIEKTVEAIKRHLGEHRPDIIVIDSLLKMFDHLSFFDYLPDLRSMVSFVTHRLEVLRQKINPNLGFIVTHNVKKESQNGNKADSFHSFLPSTCIQDFCTSGLILDALDQIYHTKYRLFFNKPDSKLTYSKSICYLDGFWEMAHEQI